MTFTHLQSIYRDYDIRGLYPDEVNESEFTTIGRALAKIWSPKVVAVGYDIRPSADSLRNAITEGLRKSGVTVVDIGVVTTPISYFVCMREDIDMTVMITASHMPSQFNGLKICVDDTRPLTSADLKELEQLVKSGSFEDSQLVGELKAYNPLSDWQTFLKSKNLAVDFSGKIIVDPANMVGGIEIKTIASTLPNAEVIAIFDEFDHTTPNHEANPIKPETLIALGKEVVVQKATLGVAFDGDADRVGFVDELGVPVPADIIGALLARAVLAKQKETAVVLDLRSSSTAKDEIIKAGGTPHEWKVGHTNIRHKMREVDACLGLELAGHFFFKETNYSEGGILPLLYVLEFLENEKKTLSEAVAEIMKYVHSGEINSSITKTPEEIFTALKVAFPEAHQSELDGLSLLGETWWANVRPSANDPVMRLNLEAETLTQMEEKRDVILDIIRST